MNVLSDTLIARRKALIEQAFAEGARTPTDAAERVCTNEAFGCKVSGVLQFIRNYMPETYQRFVRPWRVFKGIPRTHALQKETASQPRSAQPLAVPPSDLDAIVDSVRLYLPLTELKEVSRLVAGIRPYWFALSSRVRTAESNADALRAENETLRAHQCLEGNPALKARIAELENVIRTQEERLLTQSGRIEALMRTNGFQQHRPLDASHLAVSTTRED